MRTGNYMTQDRMIELCAAANEFLDWYKNLHKSILLYIKSGEISVSPDTIMDLLNQNQPSLEAMETILREKGHFAAKFSSNKIARQAQRLRREAAFEQKNEQKIQFIETPTEAGAIIQCDEENATDPSTIDLKNENELKTIHEKLKARCAEEESQFLFIDSICRALNILLVNIDPIINALLNSDSIQRTGLDNRFYIKGVEHVKN